MKPLVFKSFDDATVTKVISTKKDSPTLQEAQDFVGGYVVMAPILDKPSEGTPVQLIVNEEGLDRDLPMNPQASLTAGYKIYGNALVLQGEACWE